MSIPPVDPDGDPPGPGSGGGGGTPAALPGLSSFVRRRYTANFAVTEQLSANDLLHDVVFVSSRQFFMQTQFGKIGLMNKKPAPYAYGTSAFSGSTLSVDTVQDWIGTTGSWLVISPHTSQSEIRTVSSAAYSASQNSVSLSSSGGTFSISGFSGCDGASTPATATITVSAAPADTTIVINLNGVAFTFVTASSGETTSTIASYIAGIVSTHPAFYRKFSATVSAAVVTITARFGTLTLNSAIANSHAAPVVDPVTAPTISATGSGSAFLAGSYAVAVSAVNSEGETLMSKYKVVTLTAGQVISVSAYSLPSGATSLNWYCSPEANSRSLRFIANNDGSAFTISTLPRLSAPLPPDLNRTGAEVIKVAAVFSDRAETRSSVSASNVIKATFNWLLGNREKSINRIDLKYRDSAQDYRLIDLRLRDDVHIAKIKKTSPKEYNGQAIDNTDQAYRIASGLLAEQRDADFFYQWQATREALLLQEGDVVAITDDSSGVYNLPVIIEEIGFDIPTASLPRAAFTARKYASSLYDDSIVERTIPIVSEAAIP